MTHARLMLAVLLATSLAQAVFAAVPGIDLWVASLFFDGERGFWLRDAAVLHRLRSALMAAVWVIGLPALALAIAAWRGGERYELGARPWVLVIAGLLLGPGLLVNGMLKAYWGRARPADVTLFGGEAQFTPPFQIADQCLRNCSFTSGEAASAATLAMLVIVLAWPRASRLGRILLLATVLPIASVGAAMRVAMGRHFLSDVVFSILLCALVLLALYKALRLANGPQITRAGIRRDAHQALQDIVTLSRRLRKCSAGSATVAPPQSSRHQTSGNHPIQSP